MLAEGRNIFELPGDPGIDEGYEESQTVGGIGNDDRGEQCVGAAAGAASEGADGYPVITWGAVYIADELSGIGTVTAVSVPGSPTGRAVSDIRKKGGLLLRQAGIYLKVIQMFHLMKSLAYVQKQAYHSHVV